MSSTPKIKPPTEEEYADIRKWAALSYTPPIYVCKKCQWPVVRGYCCNICGANDPSREPKEHDK
jgi:anaerobic ribonucleoside-triphosphate reductase